MVWGKNNMLMKRDILEGYGEQAPGAAAVSSSHRAFAQRAVRVMVMGCHAPSSTEGGG